MHLDGGEHCPGEIVLPNFCTEMVLNVLARLHLLSSSYLRAHVLNKNPETFLVPYRKGRHADDVR